MSKINLSELPDFAPVAGFRGKLLHSQQMSVAHWTIEAGAELPEHSHPHEQITNLLEGEFVLNLEGTAIKMSAGEVIVIPGGAVHSGRAVTGCKIIDVWNPPREDYQ